MIRILYVSTSTTLGGAEKTLYLLAASLDHARFKASGVVSVKPNAEYAVKLESAGIPAFSVGVNSFPNPGSLRRLADIIHLTQPDIVHAIMYQAIQLSRAVKRRCGEEFKLVSSPRVNYRMGRSLPSLWVDRWLKSSDDLTICESAASRDFLIHRLGYDPSKTMTIHNGIERMRDSSPDERLRYRRELGAGPEDILLGTVGRLDRQKGHAYLLEAVAKLRVLHPVRCVIIGEGPLAPELKKLAGDLRILDYVRFAGKQPEILAWYAAMDIFVLPSLWEGLPNALLEAMALGLPVVATNVDGVPEAVEHGRSGLLCEPKDSQALFSAIQELLLKPSLRRQLGDAARERVSKQFQLIEMIKAYENAYEHL